MKRIMLIWLVVLATACVSTEPNDAVLTAELPEPNVVINFIPSHCEEILLYQTCERSMDELSCRLQFCPTLPTHEEIKLVNEKAEVIAPAAYADLAQFYLDDLASCYEFLSAKLNYSSALPLRRRLVISDDGPGSGHAEWGPEQISVIVTRGDAEFYEYVRENLAYFYEEMDAKGCVDRHETTHALVSGLPVPSWLNEGLATLMHGTDFLECAEQSFFYLGEEISYTNLSKSYAEVNPLHAYLTATCYWELLETRYALTPAGVINDLSRQTSEFLFIEQGLAKPGIRDWSFQTFGFWDIVLTPIGDDWHEEALTSEI